MHILVFGDSIAYGAWDDEGGWVNRLRVFLDRMQMEKRMDECLTYNLGVSGDTSGDVVKRFEAEAKKRMGEGEECVIIFSIGSNDAEIVDGRKTRLTEKECTENIKKLISLSKKFSKKIVFTGLANVDELRTSPVPWKWKNHTIYYKNDVLKKYDSVIRNTCGKNKVHFLEMFGKIKEEYLFDGVHPNSMGHEKIFYAVRDYLIKNNIVRMHN